MLSHFLTIGHDRPTIPRSVVLGRGRRSAHRSLEQRDIGERRPDPIGSGVTKRTTRERIVETADRLFYERGYDHTSFTDISEAVRISRGNFYFHFKTKDDILNAVIERRLSKMRSILDKWDVEGQTPEERIRYLIKNLVDTRAQIKRYGCPVGTLCSELAKLGHPSRGEANKLFTLFRTWLHKQFVLLGREQDADDLAMHVLVLSQGVSTLASAFRDEELLVREAAKIDDWLQACIENVPKRGSRRGRLTPRAS